MKPLLNCPRTCICQSVRPRKSQATARTHTRTRTRDSHTRLALALALALEDWAVRPTHPLGDPLGCGPHL